MPGFNRCLGTRRNGNTMAEEGVKCAPLCQHPGCWNSALKVGHDKHKNSEYYYYLSELVSRRKAGKKGQLKDGTFTSDGLPTLKVHTVDQTDIQHAVGELYRRSKTLPPLQLCSKSTGNHKRSSSDKLIRENPPKVKFLQMNLEVDKTLDPSSQLSFDQFTFSPVLIWKPATRPSNHNQPPPAKPSVHTHTPTSPPSQQQLIPNTTGVPPKASSSGSKRKEGLTVKTTDLTQALPGEGSSASVSGEKKASSSQKHSKGKRKLQVGDTESFSYLGDIPPHIVAEILQQLRSESSSSIDAGHSLSLQKQDHSKTPGGQSQPTHTVGATNTHLPSSVTYDLSSKKVARTKKKKQPEAVQKRRVSSFSRELSKHPLEVLKRRSVFSGWIQNSEQSPIKRYHTDKDYEPHITHEDTLTDVTTKASPHKAVHVATTLLEPPVAVVNRNRYMTPRLSHTPKEPYSSRNGPQVTLTVQQQRGEQSHISSEKSTEGIHGEREVARLSQGEDANLPLLSPRRITMDLGNSFKDSSVSCHPHSGGGESEISGTGRYPRVKPHIVHLPRLHPSISASSPRSVRTYSEDDSTSEHGLELVACGESFSKVSEMKSSHRKPEEIVEKRTSVSPDYMLVGAHFAGDHLVLSDKGGNLIHHDLNDTESNANILQVLESNTAVSEQDIPTIESFDSKELLEKPSSGIRAPPSTAAEEMRLSESERVNFVEDTISEEPGEDRLELNDSSP